MFEYSILDKIGLDSKVYPPSYTHTNTHSHTHTPFTILLVYHGSMFGLYVKCPLPIF